MIVMKFGGTSVGDAERIRQVVEIVRGRLERRPVVVVSAQGGVTNTLIELAEGAVRDDADPAALRERLSGLLGELDLAGDLLDDELDELDSLLKGITLVGDLTPRSLDRMMSFGERCSVRVVSGALAAAGVPAEPVASYDVGLLTDSTYGGAEVQQESYAAIAERLPRAVPEGTVPVVTGFVARDREGFLTTLGRGGSDYSAALFGAALGAEEIEIWTDVDGVMSADPRIVPASRTLPRMSFKEAAELAYYGAKVIHPATIHPAVRASIPIRVLNTYRPEAAGTQILGGEAASRGVRAIASKAGITLVHVASLRMLLQHGFMARLFEVFERHRVVIDMISTSEVSVSLTTDSSTPLDAVAEELRAFAEVRVERQKAILCLVGEGLRDRPDVLERIFSTLRRADIAVRVVSVGASRVNVSLLVDEDAEARAVRALHDEFFSG
jgi:aspartate kinase